MRSDLSSDLAVTSGLITDLMSLKNNDKSTVTSLCLCAVTWVVTFAAKSTTWGRARGRALSYGKRLRLRALSACLGFQTRETDMGTDEDWRRRAILERQIARERASPQETAEQRVFGRRRMRRLLDAHADVVSRTGEGF